MMYFPKRVERLWSIVLKHDVWTEKNVPGPSWVMSHVMLGVRMFGDYDKRVSVIKKHA